MWSPRQGASRGPIQSAWCTSLLQRGPLLSIPAVSRAGSAQTDAGVLAPPTGPSPECDLGVVFGGCGGVGAAVGEGPADDAWFGLLDSPPGCLFGAVVASAFGAEVALAARSVG